MRLCSIGDTDLTLTPESVAAAVLVLLLTPLPTALLAGLTLLVHESAHLLVAKRFGSLVQELRLLPFGASIRMEPLCDVRTESVIAFAGPLANFVSAAAITLWLWVRPESGFVSEPFLKMHLGMGIWNLLPIFPLDGGRILNSILVRRIPERRVRATMMCITVLGCALLIGGGLWLICLHRFEPTVLLFPAGVMLLSLKSLFEARRSGVPRILQHRTALYRGGAMEVFLVVLSGTETVQTAMEQIRSGRYTMVHVLGDRGERIGLIGEEELLAGMAKYGGEFPLVRILQK